VYTLDVRQAIHTMVNLVVRHGSHPQSNALTKSPSGIPSRTLAPKATDRAVPSPIRVPFARNSGNRPVSPLTTSESFFGGHDMGQEAVPGRMHSSDSTEERQAPSLASLASTAGGELVCDYDLSVTQLYEMLESSQWDQARIRCRTHPEEVHTWIVRRDNTDNIRWKLLPLHAAVIFQAPLPVIEGMLKEYPLAVAKRDDQGMLPLHLAFRHKSDELLLERLLQEYPAGVQVKDRRDRLPLDHGKESTFSSGSMRLYAEMYAKCQNSEARTMANDAEVKRSFESQMSSLKNAYEARIEGLIKEQQAEMNAVKLKSEQDAQETKTRHGHELDDLRDLLSRQVASGQRTTQLELEIRGLSDSLAAANQESQVLRRVVQDQKHQHERIIEEVRQVLRDQNTLHEFCVQQQEQLVQAQRLREQLLSTLLQKEDGKAVLVSNEVCQMSDNIRSRAENILADIAHSRTEKVLREAGVAQANVAAPAGVAEINTQTPGPPAPRLVENVSAHDTAADAAWGALNHDHDDDISAITENSHF
jgi:hypothetical protein